MKDRLALVVAFAALFVSLIGNATTLYVSNKADANLCRNAQDNRNKIREQIQAGDPNLLKPGDPGYAYYMEHPDEKQALSKSIGKSLDRFPEIDCEE